MVLPRMLVPGAVLATGLALGGCGTDDPSSNPGPTSTPTVTESITSTPSAGATPTRTATKTPTASAPSGTGNTPSSGAPSATPAAPAIASLLLPASGLPGFTTSWRWAETGTGPQRGPLGICQRFPMRAIGADRTVVRTFRPAGGLTGGTGTHLVSRFVDDKSADQAIAVLRTWHDRCGEPLIGYGFTRISPVVPVSTGQGSATRATRYLVSYARRGADEGTFESLGVLRSGSTVELVQLTLLGQDYPAPDPMVRALRSAADRLP